VLFHVIIQFNHILKGKASNYVQSHVDMQALLEMSDLESAEAMVQYYSERPPRLGPSTLMVKFSNYDELKTEPSAKVYTGFTYYMFMYTFEF